MDEADWSDQLDERIAAVAQGTDPYSAALAVMGCAVNRLDASVVASRVYQVWAALTDRYELRPEARPEAISDMKRAANEWLAASGDPSTREAYLDHWQYEVLGSNPPAG